MLVKRNARAVGDVQGSNARVLDQPAPDPAPALDDDGAEHDDDGGEAELKDLVLGACQTLDTLQANLDKGGDHDDGEDEHANGFQPVQLGRSVAKVFPHVTGETVVTYRRRPTG